MIAITREWLAEHRACWTEAPTPEQSALIAELPAEGVPLLAVLRDERVPPADRLWVATRRGAVPLPLLRRWLGVVVRALGRIAAPDARSLAVLPYLDSGDAVPGTVRRGARAAATAAYATTDAAAFYSASSASSASSDGDDDGDDDDAYDAAHYASSAAYAAASYVATAERAQQVADLLTILEET